MSNTIAICMMEFTGYVCSACTSTLWRTVHSYLVHIPVSSGARDMLLTQVEGAGGKAHPSYPGREGALLVWHVGGTQAVEPAITTRSVPARTQANTTEK
jgi:hypothetical protein